MRIYHVPELLELDVIAQKLIVQPANKQIEQVIINEQFIIYDITSGYFVTSIEGCTLKKLNADGTFLLFFLGKSQTIVTNIMLVGRFRISRPQVAKKELVFAAFLEGDIVQDIPIASA